MLNIVFIITIILEIVITCFLVYKLEQAKKRVKALEDKMMLDYRIFTKINTKLKKGIEKFNKFINFFTNKRIILIKNIISALYMVYEAFMLISALKTLKSFKKLKFLSSNNIKRLIVAKTVFQLLRRFS